MTMLVALSLVCASVMGFWGIFVLPVLFLVWRALNPAHYEHRLVLYHDGFSFVRGTHMFFKPHVQEEHAWHEVKVVEIRSMPSDIRARVDRLEADHHRHVSAAKHAEEPENRVKYEQQAADVRKMIDQVWQDFYRKMPVLGREQILASQASDREACFHGRIMVSIQEESLGWMTKSLALTILDVFETMMGKRDGVLALGYEQTVEPSEPDNDW